MGYESGIVCPVEKAMNVLGGRWRVPILYHLSAGTIRFNELRRTMPRVTQRMLTLDLRALEQAGFVERKVYAEVPPRVEYRLTRQGKKLRPLIDALCDFGSKLK